MKFRFLKLFLFLTFAIPLDRDTTQILTPHFPTTNFLSNNPNMKERLEMMQLNHKARQN